MLRHARLRWLTVACLSLGVAPWALADLVVVTHPHTGVAQFSQAELINIYLGRYRRLASGKVAEPLDLPATSEARALFYRRLVGKGLPEINAYWSRLVFSGKTHPPTLVQDSDEALRRVAAQPGTIAYVERHKVDARVVVVYELGE